MRKQNRINMALSYLILTVASIIIVYPLLWVVGTSLNPGKSITSDIFDLFDPSKTDYGMWYLNTIKIAVITMVVSVALITLTGYIFSRYRFVGRKNSLILFLVLQMVPQFVAIIAIYVLLNMLELFDTHLALILLYSGGAIPMNTYLAKGYFDTIPKELDEAARMDGAGHLRIFWQIILPLAKPMVAVIALFNFMAPFNDFILASLVLRSPEKQTLAVGLYNMVSEQFDNNFTLFAAGAVLSAVPIVLLFFAFQRFFVSGLTAGGTKG
ncbi:sugar ABC transporter permease [Exiguobacterium sp.]|uniref:sugar ABC transporter permease n=1 Tax=Exiguobacterium sp. TaxID=44751 RepID=UPI0028AEC19F|nr:sugar ABC transporter permease [Exiguobacterium sp.]